MEKRVNGVLFLYLKAFDATGGIEKVNRVLMKALHDFHGERRVPVQAVSPYENQPDERYFPKEFFTGYGGNRWLFMADMLWKRRQTGCVLIGHVNLAPAALILQQKHPHLKTVVVTHGIEVWKTLKGLKRRLLQQANQVIAVSRFTAEKLVSVQGIRPEKIIVLPNCLDPFFRFPDTFSKPEHLLQRYALQPEQPVLLTVARLHAREAFKGYDQVLNCLPDLLTSYPELRYILAGKYDAAEYHRLRSRIRDLGLESRVLMPGYIPDEALTDYYRLADLFVMPSKKEGFGLVFIEALACGTPVIAGHADGSAEALLDGRLGRLVDPDDPAAIAAAIRQSLVYPGNPPERQKAVRAHFNYPDYKARLESILF
ncbi:MAG: glycosyltransferase family 4 protein [Thermoanaerobaculia bacterium]|nr:glycosyltransferase family 4 protein [Thermoanaerobaculia bacterium]